MKIITIVALALCAFVNAATPEEVLDDIQVHLGEQKLRLSAGSDLVTEDDQRLSDSLAMREQGRSLVADAITQLLEGFRDVIINGNDDIPPLDPLHIDHIGPFAHSSLGVRIEANIRNFNMEGLRWYLIDHVTFNALRLAIGTRVTLPWLVFTGSYDAFARIALLSHTAGGNFRVLVNRLQTSVDIRMGTNILGGGTLILRELVIDIVINDVSVQITGMVGSNVLNNLINTLVQNAAQNLLVDQMEEISQQLSAQLFDTVNEFLSNFTLDDLLG